MPRKLFVALAAGGLVLTAGMSWFVAGGRTEVGDGFYEKRILDCARYGSDAANAEAQQCMADAMALALTNDDVEALIPELEKVVQDDPFYYSMCHPAAHTAGKQALEASDDLFELLDRVAVSTVCDWGFGHGVIDTLALRGEDPETLKGLINWCETRRSDERLYGLCSDSIGHYGWISTGNIERSAVICTQVPSSSGKTSCGGGVLMQMFEPAGGRGQYDRKTAAETIPDVCQRWLKVAPTQVDNVGCSHGAGYVYGLDVRDAAWLWLNEPGSSSRSVPEETMENVTDRINAATTNCRKLPIDPDYCMQQVSHAIPLEWGRRHPAEFDELCALFPAGPIQDNCRARKSNKSI